MKRIISLVLAIIMLGTTLSGCGLSHFKFNEEGTTAVVDGGVMPDGTITMGQWLMLINKAFGMESYSETEPYFSNVAATNPYFETVQIATEWEVVDVKEGIDVDKKLTWEDALVTLVNAGEFIDITSAKQDKINYAIANFGSNISSDLSKEIQYENAVVLLAIAQGKWANVSYDEVVENVDFKDDIVNLVENVNTNYEIDGNKVTIPSSLVGEIKKDDVYVIQDKNNPFEYTYCKVKEVVTENGMTYITNSEEDVELEDIFEEVKIQGTLEPNKDNTVIRDPYGNILACPEEFSSVLATDTPNFVQTSKKSYEIKVGDYEVSISYDLDKNLDMEIGVKGKIKTKKGEIDAEQTFKVNKLNVTQDFDYGIFKGLKYALLKVDYETESEFKLSTEKKFGSEENNSYEFDIDDKDLFAELFSDIESDEVEKTIKICSITLYSAYGVANVNLDVDLKVSIEGSITVTVTQKGTVGVEYKKGNLRFIKENSKDVDVELKAKIEAKIGIGPALYITGIKKPLVGLEIDLGLGASVAVKMHLVDSENHLIQEVSLPSGSGDSSHLLENLKITASPEEIAKVAKRQGGYFSSEETTIKLHFDVCFDATIYAILEFGVTSRSYVTKFLGDKVTLKCVVFDEDNAKLINYHVDNWQWSKGKLSWYPLTKKDPCTLNFTPFDKEEETTTEAPTTEAPTTEDPTASVEPNTSIGDNSYDVDYGDFLLLTDFSTKIKDGGKYSVIVQQLPTGYKLSDIVFVSSDTSVAKVNGAGIVEGIKGGSAVITAKTSDGKHVAAISIIVEEDETIDFEGVEV